MRRAGLAGPQPRHGVRLALLACATSSRCSSASVRAARRGRSIGTPSRASPRATGTRARSILDVGADEALERFAQHARQRRRLAAGRDGHGHRPATKAAAGKRRRVTRVVHSVDEDAPPRRLTHDDRVHGRWRRTHDEPAALEIRRLERPAQNLDRHVLDRRGPRGATTTTPHRPRAAAALSPRRPVRRRRRAPGVRRDRETLEQKLSPSLDSRFRAPRTRRDWPAPRARGGRCARPAPSPPARSRSASRASFLMRS